MWEDSGLKDSSEDMSVACLFTNLNQQKLMSSKYPQTALLTFWLNFFKRLMILNISLHVTLKHNDQRMLFSFSSGNSLVDISDLLKAD